MPENQVFKGRVTQREFNRNFGCWELTVSSGGNLLLARTPNVCLISEGSDVFFTATAGRCMGMSDAYTGQVTSLDTADCESCSIKNTCLSRLKGYK